MLWKSILTLGHLAEHFFVMSRKTHFPVISCFHIFHNTSQLQMTFCYEMLNLLRNVFFYAIANFLECNVSHFMTCKFRRLSFLREMNINFMESFTSKCLYLLLQNCTFLCWLPQWRNTSATPNVLISTETCVMMLEKCNRKLKLKKLKKLEARRTWEGKEWGLPTNIVVQCRQM